MSFTHRMTGTDPHPHDTVVEARECADFSAQAADEVWAEGAWLRAAEAGTPDTWADEDRERMTEVLGYGPPPSF